MYFCYAEEFCEPSSYHCLMPVEYTMSEDGQFHKLRMACDKVLKNECNQNECKHFEIAKEVMAKSELKIK